MSGLNEGFEGYQTVSEETLGALLGSGVIVLDTNVLLDLYRYGDNARIEFLDVLKQLQPRIFVPHQVAKEFWRRRVSVLEEKGAGKTESELRNSENSSLAVIERWGGTSHAGPETIEDLRQILKFAFDDVRGRIASSQNSIDVALAIRDTEKDPVLTELLAILHDSVGPAFDSKRQEEAIKEGKRRFSELVPPGYRDGAKEGPDEGTGDYLLWEQVLAHLNATGRDAVLITRDSKDDWWRLDKNRGLLGPRVELVEEFAARSGGYFTTVHPERLLKAAPSALHVKVSQDTIDDARRISTSSTSEGGTPWTSIYFETLITALKDRDFTAQAIALLTALHSDGQVTREEIYQITGRDPAEQKLTGFTKPILRVLEELVEEGDLPPGLTQPLVAYYQSNESRAGGFAIPSAVFDTLQRNGRPSKGELLTQIAETVGVDAPPLGSGSTIPSEFFKVLAKYFSVDEADGPAICAAICEKAGLRWAGQYESVGGTVTSAGLGQTLLATSRLQWL